MITGSPRKRWPPVAAAWAMGAGALVLAVLLLGVVLLNYGQGVTPLLAQGHFSSSLRSKGFYVHPADGRFLRTATEAGTDKVNFQTTYQRAFELAPGHPKVSKMLEIGLGCNMAYGIGKSAKLWRSYFPDADVWFAEYNATCVENHRDQLDALNVKAVAGDQADPATVKGWIEQTGGNFDLIVDDGGHGNKQMYVSFIMLFQHALKPGGMYVIEDLSVSRIDQYQGGPDNSKVVMIDALKDWIEALLTHPTQTQRQKHDIAYPLKYKMPPRIKSIECSLVACTIIKCYIDDPDCSYGTYTDTQLTKFGMD